MDRTTFGKEFVSDVHAQLPSAAERGPSAVRGAVRRSGTRESNGFAVTALVLGLLACLFFWTVVGGLLGLLALVFGILGALRARQGRAPRKGMAIAGAVLAHSG
ncbi:hypothetical protein SCYAM73S_07216 [Streptomyces cyaneofuscatus]